MASCLNLILCHSQVSIQKCRKSIGLKGSRTATTETPDQVKRQLVLDQMAKDDLDGFVLHDPTAKKIHRTPLVVLGPHFEWSGDGHDKLAAIGFPIWALWDVWSGKWLGIWVLPNNRQKLAIAYVYLSLVEQLGGKSHVYTDRDTDTQKLWKCTGSQMHFGILSQFSEAFSPELPVTELLAHQFLKSIHNTTIERGWLRVRLAWVDNVKVFWQRGSEIYQYNGNDNNQYELVQWLWPKLIQQELDELRYRFNNHVVRTDRKKRNPSGISPNVAIAIPAEYGGMNCLQSVDVGLVRKLKQELGGEDLICFVDVKYAAWANIVFLSLNMILTMDNVWLVFQEMLILLYPAWYGIKFGIMPALHIYIYILGLLPMITTH
ncbi:hypothetical protein JB92DRAFT_2768728 [Gautieria morchelliformis]|nr:hypothetical protein JB92DRAFT_2768728 [Gautieria morchelliformis]